MNYHLFYVSNWTSNMAFPIFGKIAEPPQIGISLKRTYGQTNLRSGLQNGLCELNYWKGNKYFITKWNYVRTANICSTTLILFFFNIFGTDSTAVYLYRYWQYSRIFISVLTAPRYIYIGSDSTAVYLYRYWQYSRIFISVLTVEWYIYIVTDSTAVYLYRY
jgi:hypothetical protein